MPDFARYLPLSNRSRVDESDVTSDRRAQLADTVAEAARLLGTDAAAQERFAADAGLARELADAGDLAALAAALRAGRPRRIRALADAVRALLAASAARQEPVALAPAIAGSVALWAAGATTWDRRAVVKGHTIRATDADWAFGTGPVLEGTAQGIAAFLLGVSDTPPRPPA